MKRINNFKNRVQKKIFAGDDHSALDHMSIDNKNNRQAFENIDSGIFNHVFLWVKDSRVRVAVFAKNFFTAAAPFKMKFILTEIEKIFKSDCSLAF